MNSTLLSTRNVKNNLTAVNPLPARRHGMAIFEVILTLAAGITVIAGGAAYYQGADLARGVSEFTKSSQYLRGHFATAAARGDRIPLGPVSSAHIPRMPGFTEFPDGSIQHEWTEDVRFNHQGNYVIETILANVPPRRCKLIVSHAAEMSGGVYNGFLNVNGSVFPDIENSSHVAAAMDACDAFSSSDVGWVFASGVAPIMASGAYAMAYPPASEEEAILVADAGSIGGVAGAGASGGAGSGGSGGSGSSGGSDPLSGYAPDDGSGSGGLSGVAGETGGGQAAGAAQSSQDVASDAQGAAPDGETALASGVAGEAAAGPADVADGAAGEDTSSDGITQVAGDFATGGADPSSSPTADTGADEGCVYTPGNSSTGEAVGHDKNGKNTCLSTPDTSAPDNGNNGNHYGYTDGDGTNGASNTLTNPNVANGNDRSDAAEDGVSSTSQGAAPASTVRTVEIPTSVLGSLTSTPFWPDVVSTSSFSVSSGESFSSFGGDARDASGDFVSQGTTGSSSALSFPAPTCGASTEVALQTDGGMRYILQVTRPKYKGDPKRAPDGC